MSKKNNDIHRPFKIGEICQESGVYRLGNNACGIDQTNCASKEQYEIPLAKGNRFPPCKSCKGEVTWHLVRKA